MTKTSSKTARRGADTATAVLVAFEALALETGLDAVSMRAVARRAGLTLAALQYHFPSKSALLGAFVDAQVEAYRCGLDKRMRAASDDPVEALSRALDYAADLSISHADGVFEMLRIKAAREPELAQRIDLFMNLYLDRVAALLGDARPDLPQGEVFERAAVLVATLEGLATVSSALQQGGVSLTALKARLAAIAMA